MSNEATTLAAASATTERGGGQGLRSWAGSPELLVLGGGLLLPTLLSFATLISLLDIGLPPRAGPILAYATLALLARSIPFALTTVLFLSLLAFDMVKTLSLMFSLAPTELMAALDQARRIHFFASPLYLSLTAVMVTTTLAAFACLSQRRTLARAHVAPFFVLALSFAAFDYVSNVSAHYDFGSTFGR